MLELSSCARRILRSSSTAIKPRSKAASCMRQAAIPLRGSSLSSSFDSAHGLICEPQSKPSFKSDFGEKPQNPHAWSNLCRTVVENASCPIRVRCKTSLVVSPDGRARDVPPIALSSACTWLSTARSASKSITGSPTAVSAMFSRKSGNSGSLIPISRAAWMTVS